MRDKIKRLAEKYLTKENAFNLSLFVAMYAVIIGNWSAASFFGLVATALMLEHFLNEVWFELRLVKFMQGVERRERHDRDEALIGKPIDERTVIGLYDDKLWIVGKYCEPTADLPARWEFQGVFDSEGAADFHCVTANHFIGPAVLNEPVPEESTRWPGAYYPRLRDNAGTVVEPIDPEVATPEQAETDQAAPLAASDESGSHSG